MGRAEPELTDDSWSEKRESVKRRAVQKEAYENEKDVRRCHRIDYFAKGECIDGRRSRPVDD